MSLSNQKRQKLQKLTPTGVLAEYRHKGKVTRYPLLQVKNGVDGNRVAHLVQLPSGDLAREHEVEGQFIRYVSGDVSEDGSDG